MYASDISLFYLYTLKALAFIQLRLDWLDQGPRYFERYDGSRSRRPIGSLGDYAVIRGAGYGGGMNTDMQWHVEDKRLFGQAICQKISENIAKLGFSVKTDIKTACI